MTNFPYVTVDVFTATPFTGNPLAVITDARWIDAEGMQRIAVEFNYSEVTFVLPPENPDNTARVRIFTPTCEVPFAGHPNVGTAFVLGRESHLFDRPVGDIMRFEEGAGLVEVSLLRERNALVGACKRLDHWRLVLSSHRRLLPVARYSTPPTSSRYTTNQ